MITLRPTGGLCNRMLAIDSSIKLCEDIHQDLTIIWLENYYLNAPFHKLFQPIEVNQFQLEIKSTPKKAFVYSEKELDHLHKRFQNLLLRGIQLFYFDKIINANRVPHLIKNGFNFKSLKNHNRVLVSSWTRFYGQTINREYFKPVAGIQNQIDTITDQYRTNMIGIHIRRSDHKLSIEQSPTESFIKRMNEEVEKDGNVGFFLASDSNLDKVKLKQIFGDRLLTNSMNDGDRNSTKGMEEAVIDLFCLAHTNRIIGSFFSTFSSVASELYQIPFEEIQASN